MTPQERQLIDDLFDRLAKLENTPRDGEAMSAIMQGLRKAPNAVYALVQTTLVQDEALKRADSRIQELEAAIGQQNQPQNQPADSSIRCATRFSGRTSSTASRQVQCRTFARPRSAAAVRRGTRARFCSRANRPDNTISRLRPALWRAAAAAAVAVRRRWRLVSRHRGGGRRRRGRWLDAGRQPPLDDGRRGGNQQSFGDTAGHSGGIEDRRPWSDQSGGNLARDAGVNDIGSSGQRADNNDSGSRQGFFDQASHDEDDDMDHDSDGFDGDGGR